MIISFSLYGEDLKYWMGAIENIQLAKKYYPEWICRFYISSDSRPELIELISKENCEIVIVPVNHTHSGLFWRFYAADDAEIMICRDADSRLSEREAKAVDEWLKSEKRFHIMRDHPQHNVFMPGGMWGCRNTDGFKELIDSFDHQELKGSDQFFLARYIYPQIKDDAVIHDSFNLFGDSVDFPTKRDNNEFVGAIYDQYGKGLTV